MRRMIAAVILAMATLTACTTASKYTIPGAPSLPANPSWTTVEVYSHPDSIPGEYIELAHIEAKGGLLNTRQGVIDQLRREAAEVGANGIIFEGYDVQGLGETWFTDTGDEYRKARATAIRVELTSGAKQNGVSSKKWP